MKLFTTTFMALLAGIVLASAAIADDAADVKAAVLKLNAAANAGDVEVISQYISPQRSLFNFSGRLLFVAEEFDPERAKAAFEAGVKYNRSWTHLDVKVYGNAAVVTGYHRGRYTGRSGTYTQGTRRVSEVWIKQDGKWMRVHRHASQLEPSARERGQAQAATNQ